MKDWSQIEKERNEVYNKIRSFYDKGVNLKAFELLVIQYRQTVSDHYLLKYLDRIAERFHEYTRKRDWKIKMGLERNRPKRVHFKLTAEDKQRRKEVARKNSERANILRSGRNAGKSEWVQIIYTPMGNTGRR